MAHELGEAKVEWEILFIPPRAAPGAALVNFDVATRAPFRFEEERGWRWGSTSGSALRLRERAGVSSNEPIDLSARWGFRVDT